MYEESVSHPVPIRHQPIPEVHVNLRARVGVEPEMRIDNVENGLAAIAKDCLHPLLDVRRRFPSAVVLRSPLEVIHVERIHRQALELQRRQSLVDARELRWNSREQLLAASERRP